MSTSSQANQSARLRAHIDPLLHSLPLNLLYDLSSSILTGVWSSLLAEGQSVPNVVMNLTGLPPGEALDRLVTQVLFTDFKNRCLTHAWRVGGLTSVKELIRCHDLQRLQDLHQNQRGAVFVFSHFGPKYAIAPAFQQAGVPVALFQGVLPAPLTRENVERFAERMPGMEFYWLNDPRTNRAIHLKKGVERLQRGGLVATAIDGGHGDVLTEAEFFGHRIQVARGAAVLARMTGVPLIPITVTWGEGWSMDFRVHEPIAPPTGIPANSAEFDLALTHGAVRFFDAYLRKSPEQLRLDRIARLITLPRVN